MTRTPRRLSSKLSRVRLLNEVILTLPQEFREVLVLREMEDLSYRKIAQITGTPIGTVMSRLARARALLKKNWQRTSYHLIGPTIIGPTMSCANASPARWTVADTALDELLGLVRLMKELIHSR
jgi:sigma-70-like protein